MRTFLIIALAFFAPTVTFAHVTVKPSEVGIGAYQTFNVSVPTEKDIATVGVRLVIPEGLTSVRPNVKPGWNIELIKEGEGEAAVVKELIWTGGSIPADQRDDFFFSAKTPAEATTLRWDAYQTYSDGSVVAWNTDESTQPHDVNGEADFSSSGPYSTTEVVNDLEDEAEIVPAAVAPVTEDTPKRNSPDCWILLALIMSGAALALGIANTIRKTPHAENMNA